MITKYRTFLLIAIILIGAILRLYMLGSVPPSPDWDEAALGYNAYSIAHTGKDEYGKFLPVVLRSFDDYKPAFYTYLTIPTIEVFGLNLFATRLPSALFGILTIFIVYLLCKELFEREDISLLTAFLLAISPWHIQFSRQAFETNVGLSFNILMAFFFIRGLKKPWYMLFAPVFGALSLYTYQSEKVFTPLLLFALVLVYLKQFIIVPKKYLAGAAVIGLLVISPMLLYISQNKDSLMRAQATLAFSDKTTFLKDDIPRLEYDKAHHDLLGLVLDNRRVLYLMTGVSGYLSHFDLNWLFIQGDLNRHHAPGMGLMYLFELPFLLYGLYVLVMQTKKTKGMYLFLIWFLLAPVPAAFTSGVPHAVRTLNFLPTFQFFVAFGLLSCIGLFKSLLKKKSVLWSYGLRIFIGVFLIFSIGNFFYYLNQYFVQQNYFNSEEWQYGYEQAIDYIKPIQGNYKKIIVSDREPLNESYMFFLFYLAYPPDKYLAESKAKSGGFDDHHAFGKFEFRPIDWKTEVKDPSILYIGRPQDFGGVTVMKTINFLDGKPAIQIVKG